MIKKPIQQRSGLTAAGAWSVDYTKLISCFPAEGSSTSILSEEVNNGGAPYNLLVNLSRLGARFPLRAIGRIGKDLDGTSILKDCRAHGFELSRFHVTPEAPTSFSDIMVVKETGVRTSFNQSGANAVLSAEDCPLEQDASRLFYLGTLFFLPGLDQDHPKFGTRAASVLSAARKQGMKTCIDLERPNLPENVFREGASAALKQTDLVILNVEIAEMLTGMRIRRSTGIDIAAAEAAAHKIQTLGQAEWTVLRFPTGAIALGQDGEFYEEGSVRLPVNRIISASGAGHAFAAGFLYGCHEGWNISEMLCAAHATAAACLTHKTASSGISSLERCLDLLKRYGQREAQRSKVTGISS